MISSIVHVRGKATLKEFSRISKLSHVHMFADCSRLTGSMCKILILSYFHPDEGINDQPQRELRRASFLINPADSRISAKNA